MPTEDRIITKNPHQTAWQSVLCITLMCTLPIPEISILLKLKFQELLLIVQLILKFIKIIIIVINCSINIEIY